MLNIGKNCVVNIVDIGQGGVGVGKDENNFTVFVDGALLSESVEVKITKLKKKYAEGKLIKIVEKSPYRVERVCSNKYADCGGCQIQELDYKKQLDFKTNEVKQKVARIGKITDVEIKDTIGMENPFRYRNKAQFPIKMINGKAEIGFYRKKSHQIIPIDKCVIQDETNDKIIELVKNYIDENEVSVYDEKTHKGSLRHLVTKNGFRTGEIMVILVSTQPQLKNIDSLVEKLQEEVEGFKTLVINVNHRRTNVVLGNKNIKVYGDGKITDYIEDLKFEISPLSFYQVNPVQTEILYKKAREYANLTNEDIVCDVYCGIGTISLFLAKTAKKVYGVEVIGAAIRDARNNAMLNQVENAEFLVGEAEEVLPTMYDDGIKVDVVVVDPPRKGCEEIVLDTIVKIDPKRIVYVSCNPSTLGRDLEYLENKGYKCKEIQPVDLFPHSIHVESVCLIEKK